MRGLGQGAAIACNSVHTSSTGSRKCVNESSVSCTGSIYLFLKPLSCLKGSWCIFSERGDKRNNLPVCSQPGNSWRLTGDNEVYVQQKDILLKLVITAFCIVPTSVSKSLCGWTDGRGCREGPSPATSWVWMFALCVEQVAWSVPCNRSARLGQAQAHVIVCLRA